VLQRRRSDGTEATNARTLIAAIQAANHPRRDGTQATNARTLAAHYSQFTPEEWLRLVLAAAARDDDEELDRLFDGRRHETFFGADPAYQRLLYTYRVGVLEILLKWVEVSHLLVRARCSVRVFNTFEYAEELESLVGRRRRRVKKMLKLSFDYFSSRDEAKENLGRWTAAWKGIDSAITRFCGEAGFERDQLFAACRPLPGVIDAARSELADNVQANCDWEEYTYHRLRDSWPSQAAPTQQTDRPTPAVSGPSADKVDGAAEPKTAKQFLRGAERCVIDTKSSQPAA